MRVTRRTLLSSATFWPLASGGFQAPEGRCPIEPSIDLTDWPLKITGEAQLFADRYLIAKQAGVEFRVRPPDKLAANPIVAPTPPAESLVLVYGSVLRDARSGRFRMWYTNNIGIAYAESADGVRWEKPPVGMEIEGRKTNILTRGHRGRSDTLTVFENPDRSDPTRRYLAYVFEYRYPDKDGVREQLREGIYLRTSPDGVRWKERPVPVMYAAWRNAADQPPGRTGELGDVHHVSWDPKLRKFIGHVKLTLDGVRMRGLTESDDGIHWAGPHLILWADEQDRPGDQLYSMIAFPYESMWLAYLGVYHKGTSERMDIQLASSRDGRTWRRPLRSTFLPNGPAGAFDWGVLHMGAQAPLRVGDKLYLYYGGHRTAHNVKLRDPSGFGIGLATLRPDGFVSVDAGAEPGYVVTRPLEFSASRLRINATVRHGGLIRVSVAGTDYGPVAGYLAEESVPVTGDGLALPVRWRERSDLATLRGRGALRLRFELRSAALYSFRIEE